MKPSRSSARFGVPGSEPLYLGEPQLCREAHRADVGGLGGEHHRLAGKRVGEPAECRRARLDGVLESPRPRQEQVPEIGLPRSSRATVSVALLSRIWPITAPSRSTTKLPGHLSGTPGISRSSSSRGRGRRGRCAPLARRAEHEPLGPDRGRWPGDEAEFSHAGQPISRLGSAQDSRTDQANGPGPTLANGAGPTRVACQ